MTAVAAPRPGAPVAPTRRVERVRRADLRVVAPRRRRVRAAALVAVAVTVGSLFCLVAINVLLAQGQFRLERVARAAEAEQIRYERLRLEVAALVAPDAVVAAAEQLGMVLPETLEYLEAPEAASPTVGVDRTASTLADTHVDTKASLAPDS